MQQQRMGDVVPERLQPGVKPFTHIALDLLGPVWVKAMNNSRTKLKVWPVLFMCQSTGALHLEVMHNYGTEAFLLQWGSFAALRGVPATVVSDKGSQLTAKTNYVAWSEKEDPTHWGWENIEAKTAASGVVWTFVHAGCQWQNGLAERRVGATKKTLGLSWGPQS